MKAILFTILVVANQGAGSISLVDPKPMKVLATMEAGIGPHEVAASPDGTLFAVSLYGTQTPSHEVLIVDPKAKAIVKRIDLAPSARAHGIAWRRGGIYVTLERDGAVARLDPKSGAVEWRAKTGGDLGHMLAVTADEKKIYTGNIKSNDVSVILAGADTASKKIAVGKGPEGIALAPDDRELWVAHRMGGGISIIDTARDEVVATIAPDVVSARVTFTPDGRKVIVYDMASRAVVVFDRATRKELGRVSTPEGVAVSGLASPDSKKVWLVRYKPDAIVELDLATMKLGREVQTAAMPDGLAVGR